MSWPTVEPDDMAWIGADAMREIDRLMVEDAGIVLLQMMENAGRSLADVVSTELAPSSVLVLAGSGGNGGGGLVAARHLANRGVTVRVGLTSARDRFEGVPAHQLHIADWLGLDVFEIGGTVAIDETFEIGSAEAVIDAMVGYSLRGSLRGAAAHAAARVDAAGLPVVSLDVPSGLSADGAASGPVVEADTTVTLCLPKTGLRDRREVGRLLVADISVPASIVAAVTPGPAPPFERGQILLVG